MKSGDKWLDKLSKLRVDRASGDPAPHKPLLLLTIFDLAEESLLPPKMLPLTPELASRFLSYSSIVAKRRSQRPDVRYPFLPRTSASSWRRAGSANLPTHRISFWVDITAPAFGCPAIGAFGQVWRILAGTRRTGLNGIDVLWLAGVCRRARRRKPNRHTSPCGFAVAPFQGW
jgi:hypothetical protein